MAGDLVSFGDKIILVFYVLCDPFKLCITARIRGNFIGYSIASIELIVLVESHLIVIDDQVTIVGGLKDGR